MAGRGHLHCPEHDRWLRRAGDGLHGFLGVCRMGLEWRADRFAVECRIVWHGGRLAVHCAVGGSLWTSAIDPVLPAAFRCRHAVVGPQPDAAATGAAARVDRPGDRRNPGQQQRDCQ
ncbi:hypothetical protein D3C75_916350 [compost metagenome]